MTVWLAMLTLNTAQADEGMWLLQMMKEQHLTDKMKQQGLKLETDSLYNAEQPSLKDAVGIFGRGCTGEIISGEGLILTNHHCGYGAIQQHSSEENDYLANGFWAMNREEELPTPGLTFTFIEKIIDVTDSIRACINRKEITEYGSFSQVFLQRFADRQLASSNYHGQPGIEAQCLPFFAGNRYYLFYKKVYPDVRMVAAPPSSIGKFGGETDNWMWPRHTCDFSIFRIYADSIGEPAEYSDTNVPLKTPNHLTISLGDLQEGDYAMIMGFPGSTERFLTRSEVQQRMDCVNTPRIKIREARQAILKEAMAADHKVRIQYASKYAQSSNYWKNSIGMNKAIIDNKVREAKSKQEALFMTFADSCGNSEYQNVVNGIDETVKRSNPTVLLNTAFRETFMNAIEFGAPYAMMDSLKKALGQKDKAAVEKWTFAIRTAFYNIHNKDYNHEVDRKVAKALIPLYATLTKEMPDFYQTIEKEYKGDTDRYIDDLYNNSITSSEDKLEKFLEKPTIKAINRDLATAYSRAKWDFYRNVSKRMLPIKDELNLLHKTYVRGLCEMYAPTPKAPDANFTIRLTYGNVKAYSPRNGVQYDYYTTLEGVMEKEDSTNSDFIVPTKLKELYEKKEYGRYADANGQLPVCFITTNDITGGNSGSPVMNAYGQLIGTAFDGNWESLSGDINFDNGKQRCIVVDIRYILFILDKFGNCNHLIEEMTIAE